MSDVANPFEVNASTFLSSGELDALRTGPYGWVKENTAILIVHGIGNQLPMETLNQFGKGFVEAYHRKGDHPDGYVVAHVTRETEEDRGTRRWLENVVRCRVPVVPVSR